MWVILGPQRAGDMPKARHGHEELALGLRADSWPLKAVAMTPVSFIVPPSLLPSGRALFSGWRESFAVRNCGFPSSESVVRLRPSRVGLTQGFRVYGSLLATDGDGRGL